MADYGALVQTDPEYIRRLAAIMAQERDAGINYGDASLIPGDPTAQAAAASNPHSIIAMLRENLQRGATGVVNDAQAHGSTFSGAAAAGMLGNAAENQRQQYQAAQQNQAQRNQFTQDRSGAYWDVYNRIAANPPGAGPEAPPAPAPPAPPPAPGYDSRGPLAPGTTFAGPENSDLGQIIKPTIPRLPTPRMPAYIAPRRGGV